MERGPNVRLFKGMSRSWSVALLLAATACDVNAVPGDSVPDTEFVDSRASLQVTVSDADGAPLAGVWVALDPGPREAQTDADGLARFEALGAGSWTVLASGQGFVGSSEDVTLADADQALSLTLEEAAWAGTTLAGSVTGLDDLPLAGAEILLDEVSVATTDEAGSFEATGLSGGTFTVDVLAPEGSGLMDWEIPDFALTEGTRAELAVSLGGTNPAEATYVGTTVCSACHADLKDAYLETAHYGAGRDPADAADDDALDGLSASFSGGDTVDIDELGASVSLSESGGLWYAELIDAYGSSTGPMEVVQVVGGQDAGAALAVQAGDTEALLPLVWAMAGQGLSSQQAEPGWLTAWTDGWFDAEGRLSLDSGAPGSEASYALQCAGCHVTNGQLTESDGSFTMAVYPGSRSVEHRVGCESCHGPGSVHASSILAKDILNPGRLPARQRVEVCARCHERVTPTDHPFSAAPAYAVDGDGVLLGPSDTLAAFSTAAPVRWLDAPASRVGWDQVGDMRSSPHLAGDLGYDATCQDCHASHGSEFSASLKVDPADNTMCTGCHAADFPDESAEASHSHHGSFHPGAWTPGSCTGCHMPRMGTTVRPDAVSGAGERHAHVFDFIEPASALAEFDAAGTDTLALGEAPVSACLDCHLQSDAEEEDAGSNCPCPVGNPKHRTTYEEFQTIFETVWGLR